MKRIACWLVPLAALAAVAVLSGYPFVAPGHPTSPDVWSHLVRQEIVYEGLKQGHSPFYTFMFYSGYPLLRFYGPLLAFLGGLVMLLLKGALVPSLKVLLFSLHLASGLAMFLFLRRRFASILAATLGTMVYLAIPWRVVHLAILANLPQALIYLFMPLAFLALDRITETPDRRQVVLLGLWLGLAATSHVFSAVYAVFFLFVFLLFQSFTARHAAQPGIWRAAALSVPVVLAVSAFFVVPFLIEYRAHVYPGPEITRSLPELSILLNPLSRPAGATGAYLGLSNVCLALAGIVFALFPKDRRSGALPAVVCLVLTLVLAFMVPAWQPTRAAFTAGLPGMRFLIFFVFFAAVLAGSAFAWLESRVANPLVRTGVFLGLALLIGFDCLPGLLRTRHDRAMQYLEVRSEAYELIAAEHPAKVLDLYDHQDRIDDHRRLACFPAIGYLYGRLATPYGPAYYQFASRAMRYAYPWANLVARDLGDLSLDELSPDALKALALLGVSHLITPPTKVDADEQGAYYALKPGILWEDRFLRARRSPPLAFGPTGAGLVLVSNRVVPVADERLALDRSLMVAEDWRELLDALELDTAGNRVSFIPIAAGRPGVELPTAPEARILDTRIENHRAMVELEASEDCFVRVALSYYPELAVRLDRKPVRFFETKDHFIWFPMPAGRHAIEVTAPLGPVRTLTLLLSGIAFVFCLAVLVKPVIRARPSAPDVRRNA